MNDVENINNSTGLADFFSALSEEKKETRRKIKEQIDNPESGLSSLFHQLEEVLQETKKVSADIETFPIETLPIETIPIEKTNNDKLSTDDKGKLEAFVNLMSSFSSERIPEQVIVEVEEPLEEEIPEKILEEDEKLLEEEIPEEIVVEVEEPLEEEILEEDEKSQKLSEPQNDIIAEVISNLNDMQGKTQVIEEVDQISQIRKEFEKFKNLVQQNISNQGFSGAGSGETRLEFLDDIDRDSVKSNDKALVYDSSTGKWKGVEVITADDATALAIALG